MVRRAGGIVDSGEAVGNTLLGIRPNPPDHLMSSMPSDLPKGLQAVSGRGGGETGILDYAGNFGGGVSLVLRV